MRASTLPRKFIAALAVGPQISGLANILNFRYPMFGGSRSAFSNPQFMRSICRRIAASSGPPGGGPSATPPG